MFVPTRCFSAFALAALLPLAACGGGSSGGSGGGGNNAGNNASNNASTGNNASNNGGSNNASNNASNNQTVPEGPNVQPDPGVVLAGQEVQFALYDGAEAVDGEVAWYVDDVWGGGEGLGAVTQQGLYTAPAASPGERVKVAGELLDDSRDVYAEVFFEVGQVEVAVEPAVVTLGLGESAEFTAQVTATPPDLPGAQQVQWQVDGAGTITPQGVYTAPDALPDPPTATVRAIGAGGATGEATVRLGAVDVGLTVTPAVEALAVGAQVDLDLLEEGVVQEGVTWSVNGVEGGSGAFGFITDDGVYTAPRAFPDADTTTIAGHVTGSPTRRAEVEFMLVRLDVDPGLIEGDTPSTSTSLTLTRVYQDLTEVEIQDTADADLETTNDRVAAVEDGPASTVTLGDAVGLADVDAVDLGVRGEPSAAVRVRNRPSYGVEFPVTGVSTVRKGARVDVPVTLTPLRGPQVGSPTDVASAPSTTWASLDDNGFVLQEGQGELPAPGTFVAYLDPAFGQIVFGEKRGVAEFEVTEGTTGETSTVTAELLEVALEAEFYEDGAAIPGTPNLIVTPQEAFAGGTYDWHNGLFVVAVTLSVVDHPELTADDVVSLLEGVEVEFRADRGGLWFAPLGAEFIQDPFFYQGDPTNRFFQTDAEHVARSELLTRRQAPSATFPVSLNLSGQAHGAVSVLAEGVGPQEARVSLGPDVLHTPLTFAVEGRLPAAQVQVRSGSASNGGFVTGEAAAVQVTFDGRTNGLTPTVTYDSVNFPLTTSGQALVTAPAFGAQSGLTAAIPTAPFDLSAEEAFEVTVGFEEHPGVVAGQATLSTSRATARDRIVTVEGAVQRVGTAYADPVRLCLFKPDGAEGQQGLNYIEVEGIHFNTWGFDSNPGAVSFQVLAGRRDLQGLETRIDLPDGGDHCIELLPILEAPLEPGEAVTGFINVVYFEDTTRVDQVVELYFAGEEVVVTPRLLPVPPGQLDDVEVDVQVRGNERLVAALDAGATLTGVELVNPEVATLASPSAQVLDRLADDLLDVRLTFPAAYFTGALGDVDLRLTFSTPDGPAVFMGGPVALAAVDVPAPPPVLPLNATWPGEQEPAAVSVDVTLEGSSQIARVRARVEHDVEGAPMVGFARTTRDAAASDPGPVGTVSTVSGAEQVLFLAAGQPATFRLYGDQTDLETRPLEGASEELLDVGDGVPDRVSGRDAVGLKVELVGDTVVREVLDHRMTAFNFVAAAGDPRTRAVAPVADQLSLEEAKARLAFQSKEPGEGFSADRLAELDSSVDVHVHVDHKNLDTWGLLDLGYFGDLATPNAADPRYQDFRGEGDIWYPTRLPVEEGFVPFGVSLQGVCFDADWTVSPEAPNSEALLAFISEYEERPPDGVLDNDSGLIQAAGGVSGGLYAPDTRSFMLSARTPGVSFPGLDCGYLLNGSTLDDLVSGGIDDNVILTEYPEGVDASARTVVPLATALDGKKNIRSTVAWSGPEAWFGVTTDPPAEGGGPLVNARLKNDLLLDRAPPTVNNHAITLTTRFDAGSELVASLVRLGVSALGAMVGVTVFGGNPLISGGVAVAVNAFFEYRAPADATELVAPPEASVFTTLKKKGLSKLAIKRVIRPLVRGEVEEQVLSRRTTAFNPRAITLRSTAFFTGDVGVGLLTGAINSRINADDFSDNNGAEAVIVEQLLLTIPEEAVVEGDEGNRTVALGGVRRAGLWVKTARAQRSRDPNVTLEEELGESERYFQLVAPGPGPMVIYLTPGGELPNPAEAELEAEDLDTTARPMADFRTTVGTLDGASATRFPYTYGAEAVVSRSNYEATARATLDRRDSDVRLRVVDVVIEKVEVGGEVWE